MKKGNSAQVLLYKKYRGEWGKRGMGELGTNRFRDLIQRLGDRKTARQ
jgi:hypothetical protein